jgi:hypothetical protein
MLPCWVFHFFESRALPLFHWRMEIPDVHRTQPDQKQNGRWSQDSEFFIAVTKFIEDHLARTLFKILSFCSTHLSIHHLHPFVNYWWKFLFDVDLSDGVQVESLRLLASICSKCASSESSILDESICMKLLLGFPSVILPLAHENRVWMYLCYTLWLAICERHFISAASICQFNISHVFFFCIVGYKVICC